MHWRRASVVVSRYLPTATLARQEWVTTPLLREPEKDLLTEVTRSCSHAKQSFEEGMISASLRYFVSQAGAWERGKAGVWGREKGNFLVPKLCLGNEVTKRSGDHAFLEALLRMEQGGVTSVIKKGFLILVCHWLFFLEMVG